MKRIFALVDCNNFFVSCERVFRPDLKDKPVAVLSNNDGCIVARSNEVKALGIPMGAPEFKYRRILRQNNVTLFSGNFPLYGDFSRRVVEVIKQFTPHIEVYSVDESFLEISSLLIKDYRQWGRDLRRAIEKQTGIPVSIGIGPSKTLAKAAAEIAKKEPGYGGVFNLAGSPKEQIKSVLERLPVEDVWGVGRQLAPRLKQLGVRTAADLMQTRPKWAKQHLTVRGERMVRELKGESCLPLSADVADDSQKSIAATRSFGHTIQSIHELEPAVASFAARTAARLRRRRQIASGAVVFLRSGRGTWSSFNPSVYQRLPYPTSDTAEIVRAALAGLADMYRPDFGYKKAGVVLAGLKPASAQQTTMKQQGKDRELTKRRELMQVLDAINKRYGTDTIRSGAEGGPGAQRWHSKRRNRSPEYTTDWQQLPVIR